jgi:arginyl-tRNA synthetase
MASQQLSHPPKMADLTSALAALGVSPPPPTHPNTYPSLNPLDVYRAHITEILAPLAGADPKIVLPAVQRTQSLDQGDIVVAVPALRGLSRQLCWRSPRPIRVGYGFGLSLKHWRSWCCRRS